MDWTFERIARDSKKLTIWTSPQETPFRILHLSDIHWDNPASDQEAFKRLLDIAKSMNWPTFIYGDFFCSMQGKYDKRADKSCLRPEHQDGRYLDRLVETATEFLQPYRKVICMISDGNHETSIRRRCETDLLERLCSNLRRDGGITETGSYMGYVRQHLRTKVSTQKAKWDLCYFHGSGGGAPVTKGAIEFNRLMEQSRADILICGHIHRLSYNQQIITEMNRAGRVVRRPVCYVRMSTFKQDGYPDGWSAERRHGVRPIGGWWQQVKVGYIKDDKGRAVLDWSRRWIQT